MSWKFRVMNFAKHRCRWIKKIAPHPRPLVRVTFIQFNGIPNPSEIKKTPRSPELKQAIAYAQLSYDPVDKFQNVKPWNVHFFL